MAGKIALPPYDMVEKWSVSQVVSWLKKVGLTDCVPAFEDRGINGVMLLDLTEQKLFGYQDLKIKHRSQISKCVRECRSHPSDAMRAIRTARCVREDENSLSTSGDAEIESDNDSDAWDTDFDDDVEEGTKTEVNGENAEKMINSNTVKEHLSVGPELSEKFSSTNTVRNKCIPKPPDLPLVSKTNFENERWRSVDQRSIAPRPLVRRPLSQPPPPPMPQASTHVKEQEEYEIPINSLFAVDVCSSKATHPAIVTKGAMLSPHKIDSECISTETYEVIESPEENYEIVDESKCLTSSEHSFGSSYIKPSLPPRIPQALSTSPPPLPQKPHKLQGHIVQNADSSKASHGLTVIKKCDEFLEHSGSAGVGNDPIIFNSLATRKYSMPNALFAPTQNLKAFSGSDPTVFSSTSTFLTTVNDLSRSSSPEKEVSIHISSSKYLSSSMSSVTMDSSKSCSPPPPPLPPRYVNPLSDDTAQTMATRPLPPVPTCLKSEQIVNTCKKEEICFYPWFHEIEREEAEKQIKDLGKDGAFVVRPSKRAGKENPLTLTVFHDGKVFHLNIRQRADDTYALGKEKRKEKVFFCVSELISFHQREPIILTSRGESAGQTILKIFPFK